MSELAQQEFQPRAQAALSGSPIYTLRDLRVEQTDEGLLISGTVDSYYHKQLAQEVVRAVAPSAEVVNRIRVQEESIRTDRLDRMKNGEPHDRQTRAGRQSQPPSEQPRIQSS